MALMAANLTPRFVTDLRVGFSLISSASGNHAISCCRCRLCHHSPTSLTIAQCYSGRAPEEVPQSSHLNFLSPFDRVAARRLCLNIKSGNLISMASFKPKSSELEMGQADGFENSMELPKLDADLNPTQEFLDIDREPSEDNFQQLSIQECQTKLKTRKDVQAAETLAIEALATRAFTAAELRKKLCTKKFPPEIVDSALAGLKIRGFLNDYLYAESFSRSKWSSLFWGPRRIKQVLLRKGVSEAYADKATKQIFTDEDCDQVPFLGMSKESINRLLKQAHKQWTKGENVPLETRKTRLVRWLQYRGFNWQVTNFLLKKLESQYPLQGG